MVGPGGEKKVLAVENMVIVELDCDITCPTYDMYICMNWLYILYDNTGR